MQKLNVKIPGHLVNADRTAVHHSRCSIRISITSELQRQADAARRR